MHRRTFLVATAGGLTTLAGCAGEEPDEDTDESDEPDEGDEPDESDEGDVDDSEDEESVDDSEADAAVDDEDGVDDGETEDDEGEIHEHGTIEVEIDGEHVDFTEDRFQFEENEEASDVFHFHDYDEQWHMEEERVTFAEAIDLLPEFGYDRENGNHVLTFEETVYDANEEDVDITFSINGEEVDPTEHELQEGDDLEVIVTVDE